MERSLNSLNSDVNEYLYNLGPKLCGAHVIQYFDASNMFYVRD